MRCKKCGQILRAIACTCTMALSMVAPHGDDSPHDHHEQKAPEEKSRISITAVSTATASTHSAWILFRVPPIT